MSLSLSWMSASTQRHTVDSLTSHGAGQHLPVNSGKLLVCSNVTNASFQFFCTTSTWENTVDHVTTATGDIRNSLQRMNQLHCYRQTDRQTYLEHKVIPLRNEVTQWTAVCWLTEWNTTVHTSTQPQQLCHISRSPGHITGSVGQCNGCQHSHIPSSHATFTTFHAHFFTDIFFTSTWKR